MSLADPSPWLLLVAVPVIWVLLASFKGKSEFFGSPWTWPRHWRVRNYADAFTDAHEQYRGFVLFHRAQAQAAALAEDPALGTNAELARHAAATGDLATAVAATPDGLSTGAAVRLPLCGRDAELAAIVVPSVASRDAAAKARAEAQTAINAARIRIGESAGLIFL